MITPLPFSFAFAIFTRPQGKPPILHQISFPSVEVKLFSKPLFFHQEKSTEIPCSFLFCFHVSTPPRHSNCPLRTLLLVYYITRWCSMKKSRKLPFLRTITKWNSLIRRTVYLRRSSSFQIFLIIFDFLIDNEKIIGYTNTCLNNESQHGGIAQLARAYGSYP